MSEHFVADVDHDELRHALKMWAVGYGCGTNDIIQKFKYTPEMSTLIPYDDFLEDIDFTLGSKPYYGFNTDYLFEGSQDMLELLSSFANQKCDELTSLYESYIRRLNAKMKIKENPNKIPKHN